MTTGQKFTFEYYGNGFISTVNQAVLEGQEKSKSIERGMITTETYIVFEASLHHSRPQQQRQHRPQRKH